METNRLMSKIQGAVSIPAMKINVGRNERIVSAVAGTILSYIGYRRIGRGGMGYLAAGGYLVWRGITGYCPVNELAGRNTAAGAKPFEFTKSIMIQRNRSDIYNYWRDLENLPLIMRHIDTVQKINDQQYHWEAVFNGQRFVWNAVITEDIPNERISWQSLESADVENSGTVEFINAGKKGTELRIHMSYIPAETESGKIIAGFFNPVFKQMVKQDLKDFRKNMESGEITVTKPFIHA